MIQKFTVLTNFIFWGAICLLTLFMLQVNDKFGPGILRKFIIGKYYQPKKEDRIFMFLDLKSSTTIAEKIGNEKYFNLLSNLFSHITETILDHRGDIYQYVGDEIVISWSIKNGVKDVNCINCFTEIKNTLAGLAPYYQKRYGITPIFKAGLHHGQVMAGEIGIIKKDIIYAGDVLNTAARIQAKCNEYEVDFIASTFTLSILDPLLLKAFNCVELGQIELRGRKEAVHLNSITQA